jgi:hypothetical protein
LIERVRVVGVAPDPHGPVEAREHGGV